MPNDRIPKPLGDYTIEQIEAFRPIARFLSLFSKRMREQFREVEQQLKDVKRMLANRDVFAKTYSPLGWANYDRLSTDIVSRVMSMSLQEGEAALTAYHLDPGLRSLGYRFNRSHYEPWRELFERAIERAGAGDFLSSIPLVLSIIDGICTISTGKHPFSGGADAPVFDSQTSGPGGLQEGLALLGSTRRKLDTEPISAPFRHGIIHGLNPNYGNPIVAAKAFNLLQATVDYFDRRRDEAQRLSKAAEDQKPVDIRVLVESVRRNAETRRAIDAWRARPPVEGFVLASSEAPATLSADSPESFAVGYLSLLVGRNYGGLAQATVDYPKRSISYRAGRLREDLNGITITRWTITGVEDIAAAISCVTTTLEGRLNGQTWTGQHAMRLMFADDSNGSMVRGQLGGAWTVMPDFLAGLWLVAVKSDRDAHE